MTKYLKTSAIGIILICNFEGFSAIPYKCPAGKWTIGYGHLIRKNEIRKYINRKITKKEGLEILKKDLIREENHVKRLVKVPLNQSQFDALVSWTFNLGGGNLASSTLLKTLNRGNYNLVPMQINRWVYASGRKLNGLVKRRKSECNLWNSNYTYGFAKMITGFKGL